MDSDIVLADLGLAPADGLFTHDVGKRLSVDSDKKRYLVSQEVHPGEWGGHWLGRPDSPEANIYEGGTIEAVPQPQVGSKQTDRVTPKRRGERKEEESEIFFFFLL